MKKIFFTSLILIAVGFLWFQVFNLTGISWREDKSPSQLGKEPPVVPKFLPLTVQSTDVERKLKDMERPGSQEIKDRKLYAMKCECGSCQDVLAECSGGELCPTAIRQIKELGIKL